MKRARRRPLSEDLQRYGERLKKKWIGRYGQPHPQTTEGMYLRGDNHVLLVSLAWHLTKEEPAPEWLRMALLNAIQRGIMCELDTWDEVFGSPVQTEDGRPARGRTRIAVARKRSLQFDIYHRIVQLYAQGEKIDKALFETVATEFRISRTRAEQLYYDNRALLETLAGLKQR
jgi:hypothetical protein